MALIKIDVTRDLRGIGPADLLVIVVLVAVLGSVMAMGQEWAAPYQASPDISLGLSALLQYCFFSLARNLGACVLAIVLGIWLGLWAAKNRGAERLIMPLVDILQPIPVLAFMPGLVLGLARVFPRSRVGLELACILMILSSQLWNLILGVYQSAKAIPQSLSDMVDNEQYSPRQRFLNLELPACVPSLVSNAMLSVANGWFFVTVTEAFVLNNRDFRIPGIGAYMSLAMEQGNVTAMLWAIVAMALLVVGLDQIFWRPLLSWSERFRLEESMPTEPEESWVLDLISKSAVANRAVNALYESFRRLSLSSGPDLSSSEGGLKSSANGFLARIQGLGGVFLLCLLGLGAWRIFEFFLQIGPQAWLLIVIGAFLTLGRILLACLLAAIWIVPLGVWIGLHPRFSKSMQPIIQFLNAYPAPLLFPAVLVILTGLGLHFEVCSIVLMMLSIFAYLLFNVIQGASKISREARDVWDCYGQGGWARWRKFILPEIFPSLLSGFNTMVMAAWNASIVTEYLRFNGSAYFVSYGLGSSINSSTESGNLAALSASVFVMVAVVMSLNRVLWMPLQDFAARFSE